MTDYQFRLCVAEATKYKDVDAYVSDMALSSIWGDDPVADITEDRIVQLTSIYTSVHRSVRDIAKEAGLSHRKLAERFCVPYRTMENWCGGVASCPEYTKLMMQELLGLLQR